MPAPSSLQRPDSPATAFRDSLIQSTLRTSFPAPCAPPLQVIAHRLNTILDSDKVLVMSGGHVAEFGPPAELSKVSGGLFAGMVEAA